MKLHWGEKELEDNWTLNELELKWVLNHTGRHRFGFAAQLKFFQVSGRFPEDRQEIPIVAIKYLAKQLHVPAKSFSRYSYVGRTSIRDRVLIRDLLGFRQPTVQDIHILMTWLNSDIFPVGHQSEDLNDIIVEWYRQQKIELPSKFRLERIVSSAVHSFQDKFFIRIYSRLPLPCFHRMNQLLDASIEIGVTEDEDRTLMAELRSDPGPPRGPMPPFEIPSSFENLPGFTPMVAFSNVPGINFNNHGHRGGISY